jgi:hypothetical protein
MVDDKDESVPDPWAGIDDDAAGQSADGFTFSFDAASEITDPTGLPAADEPAADPFPADAADAADDVPVIPLDVTGEIDADPFAPLSVDADDGSAVADDISEWLSEPAADAGGDPPLAVFPPEGEEDGDHAATGTTGLGAPPAGTMFEAIESDDLHQAAQGFAEAPAGASHVEVGTGFSGIASPSEVDATMDAMPDDDWPEALSLEAGSAAKESTLDDFATDDQPSFDASGFDGVSDLGEAAPAADGFQDEGLGAAAAVAVAAAAPRPAARKQGGGIGPMIAIVLGGVMAIPITYAILIWGFQRDPFKLAGMIPKQVAFLLPQKFQPGSQPGPKKSADPEPDAPSTLDELPPVADATESPAEPAADDDSVAPAADPAAAATEGDTELADAPKKMPADAPAEPLFEEPAPAPPPADDVAVASPRPVEPPAPPEPEPLDITALEAAVGAAAAAFDELTAADPEAPNRRKLLVAWYRRLAAAAEQLVLLEKVAVDSGRPLDDAAAVLDPLATAIAADATVQEDLARLGGMWLGSKKRAADGAVLLATFDGARQVGPYWSMVITVDGAEPRSVNVIARTKPKIDPGARVLVTGVVFDGDVVWAADCRPLGRETAPVEDLF